MRTEGAEVISLEDADAEATGAKSKVKGVVDPELEAEDDVEVEGDDEEDDTFLVTETRRKAAMSPTSSATASTRKTRTKRGALAWLPFGSRDFRVP